jgi:hypothetical protein
MHEDDWGHFVDLEIGKETTIQKKSQVIPIYKISPNSNTKTPDSTNSEPPPPPPLNTKPAKQKKEIQPNISKKFTTMSVIYEEEIWYKRDDEDDSDYGNNWNCIYLAPKETNFKRKEYINKASLLLYCFVCMYFISWTSVVSL